VGVEGSYVAAGRVGQEFRSIINDPLMANSAILVFANKQVRRAPCLQCCGLVGSLHSTYWSHRCCCQLERWYCDCCLYCLYC
jgi:hypothetical protein